MGYSPIIEVVDGKYGPNKNDVVRAARSISTEEYCYDVWIDDIVMADPVTSLRSAETRANVIGQGVNVETAIVVPIYTDSSVVRKTVQKNVTVTPEVWEEVRVKQAGYLLQASVKETFVGQQVETFTILQEPKLKKPTVTTGSASQPKRQYRLVDTTRGNRLLGVFDTAAEAKAAGVTVLEENEHVQSLSVQAWMCRDGEPDLFTVSRPTPTKLTYTVEAVIATVKPNPVIGQYLVLWWGHS